VLLRLGPHIAPSVDCAGDIEGMPDPSQDRPRHVDAIALWGAAAFILLVSLVQLFATFATGTSWIRQEEIVIVVAWWIAWLPLVPAIRAMVARFGFAAGRTRRSVLAHAFAAIVLSLAHLMAVTIITRIALGNASPASIEKALAGRFLGIPFLVFDLATYGGIAAALVAATFARAYRDEELLAERLRARAAALEAKVAQARLDALRTELNPHFLFNALNAVSGLIGGQKTDEAQEVLGRLGGLLRQTLRRERSHFSSVTKEMELLQDFLFIEQIRFGDRLSVVIDVQRSASECAIPTMLLQPLVENAVRHGIEPALRRGGISIGVRRLDDDLVVRIDDTGRGFSLMNGAPPREGIGLSNTRARLDQLFGGRASLTLENRADGGASVEVRMPCASSAARADRALTSKEISGDDR
jgi:two-component system LytT family sensor kinase